MRSIIPFKIEYNKKDNTLLKIQSEDIFYTYYLEMCSKRTRKGKIMFYEVTRAKTWNINLSNWESFELMPKDLTIMRSIKLYA